MKAVALCVFVLKILIEGTSSYLSIPSNAFENVSKHLFELETKMFIKNYGVESDEMTRLLLRNLNEKAMPFQLQNLKLVGNERVTHNSSAFLTFDEFSKLRKFNEKLILTNEFYKPIQLFVFCQSANASDIESLAIDANNRVEISEVNGKDGTVYVSSKAKDIIQYQYFIIDEPEFLKLKTFVFHSPERCSDWQLIEVNKFNKANATWENDKFSIEKLANFHGCNMSFFMEFTLMGTLTFFYVPIVLVPNLNYQLDIIEAGNADVQIAQGCFNQLDQYEEIANRSSRQ